MPSSSARVVPHPVALVTGASGMVGRVLVPALRAEGYMVRTLVRDKALVGADAFFWNPDAGDIDTAALEGVDVVFHLAGTGIADGRWTAKRMAYILENRAGAAATLAGAVAKMKTAPTLVVASAIGFYGGEFDGRMGVADENSVRESGFAGDVCAAIEDAFSEIDNARVVLARLGVVLGDGGALAKMLPAFKLGLGGGLGAGAQPFAWVHIDDVVRGLIACAADKKLAGAVNIVAPAEDTNISFTRALGQVLRRPVIFPMPGFVARVLFGHMAEELLLRGRSVAPKALLAREFAFRFGDVEAALKDVLKKT